MILLCTNDDPIYLYYLLGNDKLLEVLANEINRVSDTEKVK